MIVLCLNFFYESRGVMYEKSKTKSTKNCRFSVKMSNGLKFSTHFISRFRDVQALNKMFILAIFNDL